MRWPGGALQDKSGRYYVAEALATEAGGTYLSPLDLNLEYGEVEQPPRPVLRVAAPVSLGDGAAAGLVVVNLRGEVLLQRLDELAAIYGGSALLVDARGRHVVRGAATPDTGGDGPMRVAQADRLAARLGGPAAAAIRGDRAGVLARAGELIAHAPIPSVKGHAEHAWRWQLAVSVPRAELIPQVASSVTAGAILALGAGTGGALAWWLVRYLTWPLRRLARQAERLAAGDLDSRVDVHGRDEIAELACRFNDMAARVAAGRRALEARGAALEQAVAERTASLEAQRRELAAVVRYSADGILLLDGERRVRLANGTAQQLLEAQD